MLKARNARILVAPEIMADPGSSQLYAAKELRYYLSRITGVSVPIESGSDEAGAILVGSASGLDISGISDDGFIIDSSGDTVRLAGGCRGVLYAAYELLERLGVRFFTPKNLKPVLPYSVIIER